MAELTYGDVFALLKHDSCTGRLFWRPRTPGMFKEGEQTAEHRCKRWNSKFAGKEAFAGVDSKGYRRGKIHRREYFAHRVIWLLHRGSWPAFQIDHVNGDRADNRIENLRDVPGSENGKNQKMPSSNTSGVHGVDWCKRDRKWRARIRVSGRIHNLGMFHDINSAAAARRAAEVEYGFHENHGRLS